MADAGRGDLAGSVRLRAVDAGDLPILFEHQRDPLAAAMAVFPVRERPAFDAHWERILGDGDVLLRTVVVGSAVAGNVGSWRGDGGRLVGYWLGREYWGQGVATTALRAFLDVDTSRPLSAHVATTNLGSIRVLEKCGFAVSGGPVVADDGVSEQLYVLR